MLGEDACQTPAGPVPSLLSQLNATVLNPMDRLGVGNVAQQMCYFHESRRCTYVHRDELNRFLPTLKLRPRRVHEDAQPRIGVTYSPIFTGVQSSLIHTSVPIKALIAG